MRKNIYMMEQSPKIQFKINSPPHKKYRSDAPIYVQQSLNCIKSRIIKIYNNEYYY